MTASYLRLPRPTLWLVKGDRFRMGDHAPVELEVASFYLSKSPVTNEEYEAFAPDHARGATSPGDRDPVVLVSFHDATAYCRWYAELSGKPFRLPSEGEWEFACRGGTETRFFWGSDPAGAEPFVWSVANAEGRCREIETRRANPFGLHDMLGNVWEWTAGSIRGGSFRTDPVASADGRLLDPTEHRDDLGFRIVRSL